MELYAKDGQIVDQKTGQTVGLIPYFDTDNKKHIRLQNMFAISPEMAKYIKNRAEFLGGLPFRTAREDGELVELNSILSEL